MELPDRDDSLDWTLIARWFAGECSPTERAIVERWVTAKPSRAAELEALRRWWDVAADVPAPARVDAMWDGLARRIRAEGGEGGAPTVPLATPTRAPRRPSFELARPARPWRRWAVAAAACLVVGAGAFVATRTVPTGEVATAAAPATREFATARGQRATIRLADGSRVELGYDSRLRVGAFDGGRRELWLDGEAVFDVVHDTTRPFLVHAANATTEDIGTIFGVRAYAADSQVRVLVIEGSVALRPRDTTAARAPRAPLGTVLGVAQLGRLDARGRVEVESDVDTTAYLDWLGGRVAYRDAPLAEIVADLSRRFDVDILLEPAALGARRLTLTVPGKSLEQVLDAVAVPLGLRHRRSGDAFVLERAP